MADFVNLTHYASPIPAASAFIDEKVLNDPAIYPTPEIMERLFLTEVDPPKYQRQKTRVFTRAKSGLTY
jgi:putrescine transport system substrate-binding protein